MALIASLIAQLLDPVRIVLCGLAYWFFISPALALKGWRSAAIRASVFAVSIGLLMVALIASMRTSEVEGGTVIASVLAAAIWLSAFLSVGSLRRS